VDPQGSDIEDGRLTLLIVLALQRANPEQKKLLNANYGCEEPEKVEIVKQVCTFSNFFCMFLNTNISFSNMNSNCSNLLDMRNFLDQVKKAFCYQKLF
jgi:geranylgeranyl pyrophosphate synthase